MPEPKLCLVGAGNLSSKRIYPLIGQAGAVIAGVCDLDLEKASRNARLWGGTPYSDMETMLDAETPAGVIICIGPERHAQLAPVAMRRGIPVYTEKPPALTAADALAVARVSRQTGVLCMTAFKKRYNVAYSRAKEWLSQFDPDDYYSLSADYASAQYSNDTPLRTLITDFCIHMIDLVCYLFGGVDQVFAFNKGHDAWAVSLKYTCGAVGSLNFTDGRSFRVPTEEVELTVRGGNFMTLHNSSTYRITENGKPSEWREPPTFVSGGDSGNETGHLAELVDFVAAIREGRTTRSNIFESYRSMVLYEGILESARTALPVKLEYEAV